MRHESALRYQTAGTQLTHQSKNRNASDFKRTIEPDDDSLPFPYLSARDLEYRLNQYDHKNMRD
jgi:hypothetical protein